MSCQVGDDVSHSGHIKKFAEQKIRAHTLSKITFRQSILPRLLGPFSNRYAAVG